MFFELEFTVLVAVPGHSFLLQSHFTFVVMEIERDLIILSPKVLRRDSVGAGGRRVVPGRRAARPLLAEGAHDDPH